jgi:hypothetical protein
MREICSTEAVAMEMGAGVGRRRSGEKLFGKPPHEFI